MNRAYITDENWAELERRFPSAYHFLLANSLRGELRHLERLSRLSTLTPHYAQRLTELRDLFKEKK